MEFELVLRSLPELLKGAGVTLVLSLVSLILGALLALPLAIMRIAGGIILKPIAKFFITILRGTPLLIQLYLVYYGLPHIGLVFDNYTVGFIVLSLYMGAYLAEILRGAIEAIDPAQTESAYSLGLSYWQAMRVVIIPQAIRLTIPPGSNQFITMLKESSLVSQIAIVELTLATIRIISFEFRPVELFIMAALIYLAITVGFVTIFSWLEKRFSIPGLELKKA
jgi:His/Glu/Gln/Arg/opine family amino acid ABC transporter permease subunit